MKQQNIRGLQAGAEQQTWVVANKVDNFFDILRGIADNSLTINAFVDPISVEHFLEPFFRSFRIGSYTSLTITMTDFTGTVMASSRPADDAVALPPQDLWLTPAIDGRDVLAIENGGLIAAVPVRIGALPEGALLVTLSPADTEALFSSDKHEGQVQLRDHEQGIIFETVTGSSSSTDLVSSTTIGLPGFPALAISSVIYPDEETPLLSLLHGFLLVVFLADLVALVFGIYMTANLVARPLNRLVVKIQSIQKLTDPSERLAIEGPLEFRNLASAFNAAAGRQANLTASLEDALMNEKAINETQRQFVSLVSHEFRTPLAIIDGQAQRIVRRIDKMPRDQIKASMEKCRSGVARLVGLIESVLSSSKLEAGAIDFNPGPCGLTELLVDVASGQEGIDASHQIVLDIETLPDQVVVDEKLMRQVFTNLLSNAVKYSPGTSTVWVDGHRDGNDVVIAVRDQGVGIPEDEINKLFHRFFRASTSSGIAGTGIGLHLIKQLIEFHGGTIAVTSVAGKGTAFTVRFPIEPISDKEAEAA